MILILALALLVASCMLATKDRVVVLCGIGLGSLAMGWLAIVILGGLR